MVEIDRLGDIICEEVLWAHDMLMRTAVVNLRVVQIFVFRLLSFPLPLGHLFEVRVQGFSVAVEASTSNRLRGSIVNTCETPFRSWCTSRVPNAQASPALGLLWAPLGEIG